MLLLLGNTRAASRPTHPPEPRLHWVETPSSHSRHPHGENLQGPVPRKPLPVHGRAPTKASMSTPFDIQRTLCEATVTEDNSLPTAAAKGQQGMGLFLKSLGKAWAQNPVLSLLCCETQAFGSSGSQPPGGKREDPAHPARPTICHSLFSPKICKGFTL